MELGLDQKQQLQQALFPEGLRFDGEEFGTAVTCLAFKQLDENGKPKSGVASPPGTKGLHRTGFWSRSKRALISVASCPTDSYLKTSSLPLISALGWLLE